MENITLTSNTNGHGFATAPVHTGTAVTVRDWRDRAMSKALLFASDEGTPLFALLDHIRRNTPGQAVRAFYEERSAAINLLSQKLADFTPLLTTAHYQTEERNGKTPFPLFGWWRGTDPATGNVFEIALAPTFYGSGSFAFIGPNDECLNAFVNELMDEVGRHRCRCRRFNGSWEDDPEMEAEVAKVGWSDIVLAQETLSDIRRTIEMFFAQKETFAKMRFPWRRGVLLVGPPGTGKTMVCKAAAASFPDLPFLYVGEIGRRNCIAEIEQVFEHARKSAPCILAFEDMDGLVDRANRTVFLNELDGFRDNEGLLIIASSNHPERIDEALLKRPSRFDRVYHIGLPGLEERTEYAHRLLERSPNLAPSLDLKALSERVAADTEGFTPAFLKEAFLSATLQMVHEGLTELDDMFGAAVLEQVDLLRKYLKKAKNPEAMAEMMSAGDNIGFRAR
jgi:AAA+ superfamily predicted ATPase